MNDRTRPVRRAARIAASRRTALVTAVLLGLSGVVTSGHAAIATQIAVGNKTTCAIDPAGGLFCWGVNDHGQVGDGTTIDRDTPVGVTGLASGVAAASAGDDTTCVVTTSGGAKCWGRNHRGQLGDGTMTESHVPVDVTGLTSGVAAIAAGGIASCAVTTAGGAKCWGRNARGMLGDGTLTDSTVPVDVSGLTSGVAAITVGGAHACALTTGGGVKCWGANDNGELGEGTTTDSNVPVDVTGLSSGVSAIVTHPSVGFGTCALLATGAVECWGSALALTATTPYAVPGLAAGVDAISLLSGSGLALVDGAVKSFSLPFEPGPDSAVFDVPGLTSGIVAVGGAPSDHMCVLTAAGEVKCWGNSLDPALGEGPADGGRGVPGCVVGFGDGDVDRICDAIDPCTSGTASAATPPPRLVLSHIYQDPTVGDDRLAFRARFPLPPGVAFADLDPLADGARLTLIDPGDVTEDRVYPSGAYGGRGTAGWTVNGPGTKWTFTDATGVSGKRIGKLALTDKSNGAPGGLVEVNVTRSAETLDVTPTETALQVVFVPGGATAAAAGVCAQTSLVGACAFNPRGTTLTCKP